MSTSSKAGEAGLLPREVDARARRAAAVDLLRGGASYETICSSLGYESPTEAKLDTDKLLVQEVQRSREEHRALELSRLNGLIMALWPAGKRGDGQAVDRIIKCIDQRAKILGLYAATRTEIVSIDAIEAEMARLTQEMNQ